MADIAITTALTIFLIILYYSIRTLYRNRKVYKFRIELIELADKASSKLIEDGKLNEISKPFTIIEQYSYDQMLYSMKPLKLEDWFTEDEIKILKCV